MKTFHVPGLWLQNVGHWILLIPIIYRLKTAYLLLRANLDKIMHAR